RRMADHGRHPGDIPPGRALARRGVDVRRLGCSPRLRSRVPARMGAHGPASAAGHRLGADVPVRDGQLGVLSRELAACRGRDVAGNGRRQRERRAFGGAPRCARSGCADAGAHCRDRALERCRRARTTQEFERDGAGFSADVAARRSGCGRSRLVSAAARQGDSVPVFQFLMELPPSPGLAAERASARWLSGVLGMTLAVLGASAAFVAWVDPFQQYHLASRYPPRFYFLHHRYINPGLARNQAYDTVVSGSSIMENTPNDLVAQACGGSSVNLSMPAMSASEQRLMLETALFSQPVKRVIAVLDFNEFAGGIEERQDVAGPLPRYLYDRNPFNDLPYLLSWDVLAKAWHIVNGDTGEKFTSDPNGAWFWGNIVRFGREQVLRGLDLENLNARYRQPRRTFNGMRASFEHNLLPVLAAHPDTEFDLVWPPYSILVWLDFAQRDQVQVSLDFKRYVF